MDDSEPTEESAEKSVSYDALQLQSLHLSALENLKEGLVKAVLTASVGSDDELDGVTIHSTPRYITGDECDEVFWRLVCERLNQLLPEVISHVRISVARCALEKAKAQIADLQKRYPDV